MGQSVTERSERDTEKLAANGVTGGEKIERGTFVWWPLAHGFISTVRGHILPIVPNGLRQHGTDSDNLFSLKPISSQCTVAISISFLQIGFLRYLLNISKLTV